MEFSILDCFMISFVCGLFFGIVYELFRFIRRLFDFRAVVFICDVAFCIAAGFFVFQLSMYLGNYIRLYTLLGFGTGLFAYINTVGRLAAMLENALAKVVSAIFGKVSAAVTSILKSTIGAFAHNASAAFSRFNKNSKRSKKIASTLLQFEDETVYNVKRNIVQSGENIGGKYVIKAKIRRSS